MRREVSTRSKRVAERPAPEFMNIINVTVIDVEKELLFPGKPSRSWVIGSVGLARELNLPPQNKPEPSTVAGFT